MKRLPLHRRPFFAKRILEIGGGHAPYGGVTHAVDKFPGDNTQRAGSMVVNQGVVFKEGELEAIPFETEPKFDFLYASHVLEHVNSPTKAVSEINRVSSRGYLETPSPLREQISCPVPFDPVSDFHYWFCWVSPNDPNGLHFARKSADTVGRFCSCENGEVAKTLFKLRREKNVDVEPLLPRAAKTTKLYFDGSVRVTEHVSLAAACSAGHCPYINSRTVRLWTLPVLSSAFSRFRKLREVLVHAG